MCSSGNFMLQVQNYTESYNNSQVKNFINKPVSPSFGYKDYETVRQENRNYEKTVIYAGLLQLFSSSLNKISRWLGNKLTNGKEFTDIGNVQRVAGDMVKKNTLDVNIEYVTPQNLSELSRKYGGAAELSEVAAGRNAFFSPAKKLAVAPKTKPSLLLHELGHAINSKSKFWYALQKSRSYTALAPVAALFMSKAKSEDGKPNFVERNAGVLGFCAFLPTIIEEGKASLRGIKQAKKTLANEIKSGKVNLGALKKNYAIAWLTYVLAGIGLGVATKYSVIENKFSEGSQIS